MGYGTLPPPTPPAVAVEAQAYSSAYPFRFIVDHLSIAAQWLRSPGPGQPVCILFLCMVSIGVTRTFSLSMPVCMVTCRSILPVSDRSHGSSEGIGTLNRTNFRPFGLALMRYTGPQGRRRNSAARSIGFWGAPSCLATSITHISSRERTMLQYRSAYGALCAPRSVFGPGNLKDWRPTGFGP